MTGEDLSDPFLWDEDRVVLELCTSDRSWKAPPAKRLPDPAVLEASLREAECDGQTLLTCGDELGFDTLWRHLGIKKLPHQLSLKEAITQFQRRSPKYREWKTQQSADSQLCGEDLDDMLVKAESHKQPDIQPDFQVTPVPEATNGNDDTDMGLAMPGPMNSCPGVLSPALSASIDGDLGNLLLPPVSQTQSLVEEEPVAEPPSKKRRIAPITVSIETTGNSAFGIIPTEGDFLSRYTEQSILETDDVLGFLGPEALLVKDITDPLALEPSDDDVGTEFAMPRKQLPPGRRIQVSARMKRYFRSPRLSLPDGNSDPDNDPLDPVLPQFGDSDDESVDTQTWNEFQQEEEERARMEARRAAAKDPHLTKEEIEDAITNALQELESQWAVTKKPKYDNKARKTWQQARCDPNRAYFIDKAKKVLDHCVYQIARLSRDIIGMAWTNGDDLQDKLCSWLKETVFEKKYRVWYLEVVQSPHQPPKPPKLTRPAPKPAKQEILDDESEVLTSDSDMDSFIEYDDVPVAYVNDEPPLNDEPPVDDKMDIDLELPQGQGTTPDDPGHDGPGAGELASPDQEFDSKLPSVPSTPKKIKIEQPLEPATPRRIGLSPLEPIVIASSPPQPHRVDDGIALGFDDLESLERIGKLGTEHWREAEDAERLLVAVLFAWPQAKLVTIHDTIKDRDDQQLWAEHLLPAIKDHGSVAVDSPTFILCRLFEVFISKNDKRANSSKPLRLNAVRRMDSRGSSFKGFCRFLQRIVPLFLGILPPPSVPLTPTRSVAETPRKDIPSTQQTLDLEEDFGSADESSLDDLVPPSTRKRRRKKRRDQTAADLRANNANFNEELERRARDLREQMAKQGSVTSRQSRLIVNESKKADQALIYINDHIGSKIKDHQIEGVRFMWNQVVVDSSVRQGCLLAHTMGLGKTMQVITLLVVIAESAASSDESARSQIPENLRNLTTLVLCPPSLVDNWHAEIKMWAPRDELGPIYRLDVSAASRRVETTRAERVRAWASAGGCLVVGYTTFTNLVKGDDEIARLLLETPSLVVGDEAHYLKNPDSQRHQATANFRTMNRIAMTGSPLTNHVMDYYAMINWVAPGYLADIAEFRERFANPIKEGLYADSEPYQKRRSRRMLHVLKATVEPKVHRRDIEVLLNELPPKKEFIITLPLTKLQDRLYRTYIEFVTDPARDQMTGQARAWSLIAALGPVLAHPLIFKTKAEAAKANPPGTKSKGSKSTKPAKTGESDEEKMDLPQDALIEMLAKVAVRELEDYSLSNKILVLLRILEECKKVSEKVLVFSQSISTLNYIEEIFKRQRVVYKRLDGDTRMGSRQESVNEFNADAESAVYLISTRAGGIGLNIQGANRVAFLDSGHTPAEEQQAVGRAYRIGQTKPVYVYYLMAGGTYEEVIHKNAVFKTQLASRVVDKKNPDPWSKRFSEYFTMPREVDQEDLSAAFGQDKVLDALLSSKIGGLIRKITSTETFEREEKFELTKEERQEAERDIEMERLRSQNPEEFRRREQERAALQYRAMLAVPSVPPTGFNQPGSVDALAPPLAPLTHQTTSTMAPPPGSAPAQALSQFNFARDSAFPGREMPPPRLREVDIPSPEAAVPQPVLAAGSLYKVTAVPSPPAAVRVSSPNQPTPLPMVGETVDTKPAVDLVAVHEALCQQGRHVRHHPSDLMNRITAILTRNKMEKLPMLDKLQNLNKFSRNHRFAEAMLSGYMEPEQLASLSRSEMERISSSLNGMSEAEFKQRVWTSKADLNQLRAQTSTTTTIKTERMTTTGSTAGSGEVVRENRGNRGVLRFIEPESQEPTTPVPPDAAAAVPPQPQPQPTQDRRRESDARQRPGDSADLPQVID